MLKPRTCCIQKLKCLEQKLKRWCSKKLKFWFWSHFTVNFISARHTGYLIAKRTKYFYAADLLPVVCQFGREFFRVCWLLSDKNLNALKTSRYKTFLCRLRLNSLLLSKKFWFFERTSLPERGIEPTTSQSKDGRSTIWAIGALMWVHGNLEVYIMQCRFWIWNGRTGSAQWDKMLKNCQK